MSTYSAYSAGLTNTIIIHRPIADAPVKAMNNKFWNSISVSIYWRNRPSSLEEHLDLCQVFLTGLTQRFRNFSKWYILDDKGRAEEIDLNDLSKFQHLAIKNLPKWAYVNENESSKTPELSSKCKLPFSSSFTNKDSDSGEVILMEASTGRGDGGHNSVIFRLYDTAINEGELERLFEYSIEFWKPETGSVSKERIHKEIGRSVDAVRVGWLTFIRRQGSLPCMPDAFDKREFAGGSLIKLRCSLTDVDGASQSLLMLGSCLDEAGWAV